jgi:rRNA maturation RNase YbeY
MTCTVYQTVERVGVSHKSVKDVVSRTLRAAGHKNDLVSVHFIGDRHMRTLNKRYRNRDKTTDVLSFATEESIRVFEAGDLGDIFVSVPQIARQAKAYRVRQKEELIRMIIHGVLHLLGFDHIKKHEAKKMFALQEKVLKQVI